MIKVTKLDRQEIVINAELIENIQATPDTIITLINEKRFLVRDEVDEVVDRVIAYRRRVLNIEDGVR